MTFLPPNWPDTTEEELPLHIALLEDKERECTAVLARQKADKLTTRLGHARAKLKRLRKKRQQASAGYEAAAKEVAALEETIDAANTKLSAVQDAITTILPRQRYFTAKQNLLRNTSNPFLCLPNEIIIRILTQVQCLEWDSKLDRTPMIELNALLVCHELKKLALQTAILWRTMGFFATRKYERFELYLNRSKQAVLDIAMKVKCPLTFNLDLDVDPGYDNRFPLLIPHLHRVRFLRIHAESQPGLWVMSRPLHRLTAPNLCELDVSLSMAYAHQDSELCNPWSGYIKQSGQDSQDGDSEDWSSPFPWRYLRLFREAPKLRTVRLENAYFSPKDLLVAHLDTLDLRANTTIIPDMDLYDDRKYFGACQASLKHMVVNRDAFAEWSPRQGDDEEETDEAEEGIFRGPIHLPALQSLVIAPSQRGRHDSEFDTDVPEMNVLYSLRAPSIVTLAIDLRDLTRNSYKSPFAQQLVLLSKWPELVCLDKLLLICETPWSQVEPSDWVIDAPSPLRTVKDLFVVGDLRMRVLRYILASVPAATRLTLAGGPINAGELKVLLGRPDVGVKNLRLVGIPNVEEVQSVVLENVELEVDRRALSESVDAFLDFRFQLSHLYPLPSNGRARC